MIQNPTMPVQTIPQATCPIPTAPEFNAIKINIQGAQVGAPAQTIAYPTQSPVPPQEPGAGQNLDVQA